MNCQFADSFWKLFWESLLASLGPKTDWHSQYDSAELDWEILPWVLCLMHFLGLAFLLKSLYLFPFSWSSSISLFKEDLDWDFSYWSLTSQAVLSTIYFSNLLAQNRLVKHHRKITVCFWQVFYLYILHLKETGIY